jgi:hypothetical protein
MWIIVPKHIQKYYGTHITLKGGFARSGRTREGNPKLEFILCTLFPGVNIEILNWWGAPWDK